MENVDIRSAASLLSFALLGRPELAGYCEGKSAGDEIELNAPSPSGRDLTLRSHPETEPPRLSIDYYEGPDRSKFTRVKCEVIVGDGDVEFWYLADADNKLSAGEYAQRVCFFLNLGKK